MDTQEQHERISTYLAQIQAQQETYRKQLPTSSAEKDEEIRQKLQSLQLQLQQWQEVLENNYRYEIICSNYRTKYLYTTVNWKYRLESGAFDNASEHLLNHQKDRTGKVNQIRKNILFIDTKEIVRHHDQQNKEIEDYLNTFPIQTLKQDSSPCLFARIRPEAQVLFKNE